MKKIIKIILLLLLVQITVSGQKYLGSYTRTDSLKAKLLLFIEQNSLSTSDGTLIYYDDSLRFYNGSEWFVWGIDADYLLKNALSDSLENQDTIYSNVAEFDTVTMYLLRDTLRIRNNGNDSTIYEVIEARSNIVTGWTLDNDSLTTTKLVGINKSNPQERLDIAGNVLIPNNNYYKAYDLTGTARNILGVTSSNYINIGDGAGWNEIRIGASTKPRLRIDGQGTQNFIFQLYDGSLKTKMILTQAGYLGLGDNFTAPLTYFQTNISESSTTKGSGHGLAVTNSDATVNNLSEIKLGQSSSDLSLSAIIGGQHFNRTGASEGTGIYQMALRGGTQYLSQFNYADTIKLYIAGVEKMRLNENGRLLLGQTTDNGLDLFQVNGNSLVDTCKANVFQIGTSTIYMHDDGDDMIITLPASTDTFEINGVYKDKDGLISSTSVSFGSDNQIPIMNSAGTDFEYDSDFTWDANRLYINKGTGNIFIGDNAGDNSVSGTYNICMGTNAGGALTTGNYNFIAGKDAGDAMTQAQNSIIIGNEAGSGINTGNSNVLIGYRSGRTITTNSNNTFIGADVGYNQIGTRNTFIGAAAGGNNNANADADDCVLVGYGAGASLEDGDDNVFIGRGAAGGTVVDGTGNICIGFNAGNDGSGDFSNKLYIENSNSSTPLIYGEFDNDSLRINGVLEVDSTLSTKAYAVHLQAKDSTAVISATGTRYTFTKWVIDTAENITATDSGFVAPINGFYYIYLNSGFSGINLGIVQLDLYVNNTIDYSYGFIRKLSASGDVGSASFSGIRYLNANDILKIKIESSVSGTLTGERANFGMYRIPSFQ